MHPIDVRAARAVGAERIAIAHPAVRSRRVRRRRNAGQSNP